MSFSPEDFQRLQASLLELKNQNYALEDRCRKQKNAFGEATAKVNVLEQELSKAQKVIQKSKKAGEVQRLLRDNDLLQKKLSVQDEDFRLQNQTLLEELAKLVANNEKLEKQIATRDKRENTGSSLAIEEENTTKAIVNDGKSVERPFSVSSAASKSEVENRCSPEVQLLESTNVVSFRKQNIGHVQGVEGVELPCEEEQAVDDVRASDVDDWKERCLSLQNQVEEYQEKLKRKQECLRQIQEEKEQQFQLLTERCDKIKAEKDQEIQNAKEMSQRLQGQLNHGHTGFSEFRQKKVEEVRILQEEIQSLRTEVVTSSGESLEQSFQKVKELEEETASLRAQCIQIHEERESLSKEVKSLLTKANAAEQERCNAEQVLDQTRLQLDESVKTSEKRKSLLDDMAVELQKKTDEAKATVEALARDFESNKELLLRKEDDLESTTLELRALHNEHEAAVKEVRQLKKDVGDLSTTIDQIRCSHETQMTERDESSKEEIKFLKADHQIALRDLNMQLEIANAQRMEFEERVSELLQEVKDMGEERKISEKKGQALSKDLKRQLQAERQRNEKLSEKLDKVLTENSNSTFLLTGNVGNLQHESLENEDAKSNGSWSIYSDGTSVSRNNAKSASSNSPPSNSNRQNDLGKGGAPQSNAHGAGGDSSNSSFVSSPVPEMVQFDPQGVKAIDNNAILLAKIEALQREKFSLEQKSQMLEASAAAMADDLVRKSDIILHYCMEGKNNIRQRSVSGNSTADQADGSKPAVASDKLKKVIDILKHPEQHTLSLKNLGLNPNQGAAAVNQERDMKQMQRMLEETLTKNMHLQKDLEHMSQEVVRLSKQVTAVQQQL